MIPRRASRPLSDPEQAGPDQGNLSGGPEETTAPAATSSGEQPPGVGSALSGGLSAAKRALLEQRQARLRQAQPEESVIPRRRVASPCVLSLAQERLWFLDQWAPGSPTYNAPYAVRLSGSLNLDALRQAIHTVGVRHEALRTTFPSVGGRGVQVIADEPTLPVPLIDLTAYPEAAREVELSAFVEREARRSFDLTRDSVLWVAVVRLAPDEHVLMLVTHHIGFDAWSRGVLFRELTTLYEAFAAGRAVSLPELPLQYADFAVWQQKRLRGERLERLAGYWTQELAGAPTTLELPTDRPRPPRPSYRGGCHWLALPGELVTAAQQVGQRVGATLYMTLLAGFNVFLYAYTGREDLLVGTPVAGRSPVETEQLIGFFINTMVVRTTLAGVSSFRELLGRVRESCLGAYEHQELPFVKLVEAVRPVRDPSRNPLFQVNFRVQVTPPAPLKLPGLRTTPIRIHPGTSKFDMAVELHVNSGELGGFLEYSVDLFDEATAVQMATDLGRVLGAVFAEPERPVRELPVVAEIRAAQQARLMRGRAPQLRGFRDLRRTPQAIGPSVSTNLG